jgi:GT2 family glycosyltransferase
MLTDLWSRLPGKLGNWLEKTERKSLKLLHEIFQGSLSPSPEYLSGLVDRLSLAKRPAQFDTAAILPEGLKQSEMACRLAGAVVIICQVNYHVRNAAQLLPSLRNQGYRCIVMDNSTFVARGARKSSEDDRAGIQESEYVLVQQGPYGSDWLANASLVVTYNDFNDDFREALEFRRLLGNRSVSVVEGINDFLRVDFAEPRYLPYRRCDTVFLAGSHDRRYFTDRETYVTGLPIIEALINKKVQFPSEPLAILNVNFTYGALEDRRDEFVTAAAAAFKLAGWQWVITQHPMDQGVLDGMPVSRMSQYELIDTGSVFVSRFATGILEALASGKPAIYFNPHGEQVTKFKDPNGAFFVANNSEELVSALENTRREIEAGVDFRGRASDFLEKHTGYALGGPSAEQKFAKAVNLILKPLHSINQFFESGQHKLGQLSNKYAPDIFNNSLKSLVIDISYAAKSEMEGEPNISVIIPCFNGEAYLPICLESLKRQTLPHNRFEIICIDDCSTDDTPQILASYQNQMSNLRIIRHAENRKQGAARNTGLDVATGRYVTFLDSDDFLRIDALEIMLNQVGEKDLLVCQHILTRFDRPFKHRKSNRHVVTSLSLAALENTIGWWPFGMLIERKMLEGANIRFREGVFWEDIDFNIRVCLNAKSYVVSPEVIYYYIQHGSSTVNSIDEKKLVDSVSAIAHVEGTELSKVSENEQTKFRKAASWWLLYQSRRLGFCCFCLV